MATEAVPTPAPPPPGVNGYTTVDEGKFKVSSNQQDAEQIKAAFQVESPDQGSAPEQAHEVGSPEETRDNSGPERGPDGRYLPKEAKADEEVSRETKEAKEEKLGKPRDDPRARMLEATRKEAEAKRQAADLQRERDEARAELNRLRSAKPPEPAHEARPQIQTDSRDPEPSVEKYQTYEAFTRDQALWAARQAIRERETHYAQQARAQQAHQQISGIEQKAIERLSKAAEDTAWVEKTKDLALHLTPSYKLPPGSRFGGDNVIADHIMYSEQAPALLEYLSDNPKEFQRIASLQAPWFITREMAKLEGRLEEQAKAAAPAGTVAKVSTARPPVRPVTGSPTSAVADPDSDEESFEALAKRRKLEKLKARR